MTVPLNSKTFDVGVPQPLKGTRTGRGHPPGRALAIVVTVALHIAVAVGLVAGVHVVTIKVPPALMVHISPEQHPVDENPAPPPPLLQKPEALTVPLPEFQMQAAPSPVMVQQQPATAPAAAGVPKIAGEGHDVFLARLLGQLNRFKQYPRAARQAHIQGVVMLHFVMDAGGNVLSAEIVKGSGFSVLDSEALALIRRAQPLPALPADFPTRTLDAVVPVEFFLDR